MRNGRSVALGVWVVLGAFACSDASGGCGWWYDDPDRQHMPRPQKVRPDAGCDGGGCRTDAAAPRDGGSIASDGGSGARDGGTSTDAASSADAAPNPSDAGSPSTDSGTNGADARQDAPDATDPTTDAGTGLLDGSSPLPDAAPGLPPAPLRDSAAADAGSLASINSFVGACDTRAREGECTDLHGAFDSISEEAACGSSGGAWSSAPCPTVGRVGRCTITADLGDGPVAHVISYYDTPQLVDALEAACAEVRGFWAPF